MPRKYKPKQTSTLEQEIINKVGNNKTKEKTFNNNIFVDEPTRNQILGFYTYRGEVFILDGLGMDVDFSSYNEKNKTIIYQEIMKTNYS